MTVLALVAACVIGCGGFVAGVLVSHGFGDGRGANRHSQWGPGQRGGYGGRFRDGQNLRDGQNGPGWQRVPRHRGTAPAPIPSATMPPAQPSAPSPAASPTA
ncbi:hypothetical protein HC031_02535 [Planosporangium thailandense]|uniref:Secreted protein n=1 Tax=Planosporangium thailandense TaxID=765197 RepID=A0ABX0XRZ5_9ACTN|nr:hypothetical protein [Planosporangium thailandense]NJC68606.1 hypothetical protein [Planosporangium thailandense]